MYSDNRPCEVCGAEVRLRSHTTDITAKPDDTIDDRVCTNPDCPTNAPDKSPDAPTP